MKGSLLVFVLSASTCAAAHESTSNAVLYGIVDVGAEYTSWSAGATAAGGHVARVSPGIMANSRWGIRGTEDLGGGNRAVFNLEAGLHPDDGTAITNGAPTIGFGRRSWVGLEGAYGQLTLGRDYVPGHYVRVMNDAFSYGLYGNLISSTRAAGTRINNGIYYYSPSMAGVRVRAVLGVGNEGAGGQPNRAGRFYGGGLEYLRGGLFVSAAVERREEVFPAGSSSIGHVLDWGWGAKYDFGQAAAYAGLWINDPIGPDTASNGRSRAFWLGGSVKVGAGSVIAQAVRVRVDRSIGQDPSGLTLGLGYVHPLSKRTSLYAAYGTVRNNEVASFGLMNGSVAVPAGGGLGSDPSALALGVRHSF